MCIDFFQRIFYPDESDQIRIEKYKDTRIVKKIKQNRKKKEEEEKKEIQRNIKYSKDDRIIQDWYN